LLKNQDVRAVSFVGSSSVARHIYKTAAETGMRAQCQGQAKNFIVIMPDADMKNTISASITSACGCAGQRCLAGENYIPVGEAYEPFKKHLLEAASKVKMGYGLDPDTQMGPLASEGQLNTVLKYIQKGVDEGATLLLDGRKAKSAKYPKGYFVGPTIFDNVKPNMTIFKEEIFGPVMGITKVDTLEEAIKLANTSIYGNAAAIFTSNGKAAREFTYKVDAGNVGINIGVPAPIAFFPFGGYKESFFGDLHAQGTDALEFYTQKKISITRWF
jgi:malonate-semialdehyde dehydrogenase (acetylating)/methylmalonate-semialdehyde dehydrogenase